MGTKKSMGLSLIIFLFLIISCDRNPNITTYEFTIFNNSGVEIVLKPNSSNAEAIFIGVANFFTKKVDVSERDNNSRTFNSFQNAIFESSDSITIIFNNSRKLTYVCSILNDNDARCNDPRNILSKIADNDSFKIQYTFTVEDFNNATPCNGPCE